MAKRKRKKPGLNVDPKRQAHNSLRGYLYQIWHSVNAWLDLNEDEILYLEGAEDFDTVSDDTATAVQVKDTRHRLTLRSQEVNDAINHYWELRMSNVDRSVKFRFLTRSKIGVEQGIPFGKKQSGLHLWNNCSGDEAVITTISDFLQTAGKISEEVKDFLKQAEPQAIYEQLIEPITWETGSKPASFVEQSINEKLVLHGNQLGFLPAESKKVFDSLINEAWKVATQKENRVLTKVRFLEIFEEQTTQRVPLHRLRRLEMLETKAKTLGAATAKFLGGSSDISIQPQSSILNAIPPILHKVTPRADLLTRIQAEHRSTGVVVIRGGAGKGKTTLAKLTANAIGGCWFWLNLTGRKPIQVVHLLQQLASEATSQCKQINIVLDDLNLDSQQLRCYVEGLGVLVYRVRQRRAKLLITSQEELPNSLIRKLGVSTSIVVDVPGFTLPEIEQFAKQLGCPADDVTTWASLVQLHTLGHPSLVHVRLDRLRETGWRKPNTIEDIVKPPKEVGEERGAARQLLMELPDDHREFLYRLSLMPTGFRRDYALNIGEIPEPISHPGDIFDQLVGPWIDRVDESYYTISPLLRNTAQEVWPEGKIKQLHAQVANAILNATDNATPTEAWAVIAHSIGGQNKEAFIAVISALITAPENDWGKISREFSMLIHIKIDPPEELFPGDAFVNHLFRSLQYRIAVEVEPDGAPKILEIWDKETASYEPHQSYPLNRLILATQALIYYQVSLPAKQLVGYLKEVVDITYSHKDILEIYDDSRGQLKGYKTDKSNFFSILYSFIYARRPIYAPFLSDLIDALDELQPKIRTLLLADFEDDSVDSRLLIDGVWLAEENLVNPDWQRCLQVFDKVIEKALAWDYPHLAAASARGKAIIHDEYLNNPDAAHEVLKDVVGKVKTLPVIEEEQANVYLRQKRYKEALSIYKRILPEWNSPSEQVGIGPLEEYRRAAICAGQLNDWEKAATFFEDGARRTQRIENTGRHIGLYADAGFAQFKAGKAPESIDLLNLALEEFEKLSHDKTDIKYFTLKQLLGHTIGWMAEQGRDNKPSERVEPQVGMCSNPEPNEKFMTLPDFPIGYAWLCLAQVEYKLGHGRTVLDRTLQNPDRDADPKLNSSLCLLEIQRDFRNKNFDNLPNHIHQLVNAYGSIQKHNQTVKGAETEKINSIPVPNLSDFASVENIIFILGSALIVRLRTSRDMHDILAIWRTNSSESPIKENMLIALDLIESTLFEDRNIALRVMRTQDAKYEKRLVAALRVVYNIESSPEDLFRAHTLITSFLIRQPWEDFVVTDLAELFSAQWLEKIKLPAMLQVPRITVPQIERACMGSGTGKKKIGQILLAVYHAVSLGVPSTILQQVRSWTEAIPEQKLEPKTGQNPIAQRIIEAMEKPPHLTYEDGEALRQSIEEGKMPVKFDSLFESDEPEKQ